LEHISVVFIFSATLTKLQELAQTFRAQRKCMVSGQVYYYLNQHHLSVYLLIDTYRVQRKTESPLRTEYIISMPKIISLETDHMTKKH